MNILKKLLCAAAIICAIVFTPNANAEEIKDVTNTYYAYNAIVEMVDNGVMTLNENGNFNPEGSVKRGEFVSMLLKVLNHKDIEEDIYNPFKDVKNSTDFKDEILKSESIGLVYGYPDKTFKSDKVMTKAEVNSVMSHITKETVSDLSLLDEFDDINSIPFWAKKSYAKTVKYGLYINYPNPLMFEANKNITRAQTAVLLAKLKSAIDVVKDEYKADPEETTSSIEHLDVYPDTDVNTVTITNLRKIIAAGNVIPAEFNQIYKSKDSSKGDALVFVIKNDLITKEGTLIVAGGTKLNAVVEDIKNPKWFNKNGEVKVKFTSLELANGTVSELEGYVLNNRDGYLKEGPWKKLGYYTLGGLVTGSGAGLGVGIPSDNLGTGLAIGLPVGASAGLAVGLVAKGTNFTGKVGDKVFVKLLTNVNITESL